MSCCSTELTNRLTRIRIDGQRQGEGNILIAVSTEVVQSHCCNDRWLALLDYPLENADLKSIFAEYRGSPELDVSISHINVTADFLRKLFQVECLKEVHSLGIVGGHFEEGAREEYFRIIAEKKPKKLQIGFVMDNSCVIPKEKLRENNISMESYSADMGHLNNVSPQEIRSFLESYKDMKFTERKYGNQTQFKITNLFGESCSISMRPTTDIDLNYYHYLSNN